jgi:hypothetical protein
MFRCFVGIAQPNRSSTHRHIEILGDFLRQVGSRTQGAAIAALRPDTGSRTQEEVVLLAS